MYWARHRSPRRQCPRCRGRRTSTSTPREVAGEADDSRCRSAHAAQAHRHPRPARQPPRERRAQEAEPHGHRQDALRGRSCPQRRATHPDGEHDCQVPVRAHPRSVRVRRAALPRSSIPSSSRSSPRPAGSPTATRCCSLGPPDVGKTHLAVALRREAIYRGYTTLFTSATALVTALTKAHHDGRLEERLAHFAKPVNGHPIFPS